MKSQFACIKYFFIDGEEKLRGLLVKIIGYEGFEVFEASMIKSGLKQLDSSDIDVVLCDGKLPDGNGGEKAKFIKERYLTVEVILLTAFGKIPDGVQAVKNGAFDYITEGDDNNRIIPLLYEASEKASLSKRVKQLEKQLGERHTFDRIIGYSKPLLKAIDFAKKVATTDTKVLITGEIGIGKEVFAQAIQHDCNDDGS